MLESLRRDLMPSLYRCPNCGRYFAWRALDIKEFVMRHLVDVRCVQEREPTLLDYIDKVVSAFRLGRNVVSNVQVSSCLRLGNPCRWGGGIASLWL